MCLAAATGEWDAGLGARPCRPSRWCSRACATSTRASASCSSGARATVIGASPVETLVAAKNALEGAPVFVHLDLDVIDPEHFPAAVPAPGGLHPDKLYDLMDSVLEDCELVGIEITNFDAPDDEEARAVATETAMHVLEPVLEHLVEEAHEHRAHAGRHARRPTRRCARSSRTCTSAASRPGWAAARSGSRASTSRTSSPRASGSRS